MTMLGRPYLDRSVPHALDFQSDPLAARVQLDGASLSLDGDDCAGLLGVLVHARFREGEHVGRGNGQERSIQGPLEVAILGRNGVVDSNEVGAGGEGALDHQGAQ